MAGKLILVGTPIGNLGDMSPRAIEALKEADLVAAEDTRNSLKLMNRFDIHTEMTSYHEHNKAQKGQELVRAMQEGRTVALITDAGMPAISDPGEDLVRLAREAGIAVSVSPGPAAFVAALAISGLPSRRFIFEGFLSRTKKERRETLAELSSETRTIVLYESPHHLKETLADLFDALGADRRIAICRELTKQYEEVLQMSLQEACAHYEKEEPRGEYVLVIEGRKAKELLLEAQADWQAMPLAAHMRLYEEQGFDRKEAMRQVAKDRGVPRREIYAALLSESSEEQGEG